MNIVDVIFIFYIILAKAAHVLTDSIFRRLAKLTKSEIDDRFIDLLHRPVFFTVVAIGSVHAIQLLNVPEKYLFYSRGILFSILAVLWCVCLIKLSNFLITKTIKRVTDLTGLSREVMPLIETVLYISARKSVNETLYLTEEWQEFKPDIDRYVAELSTYGYLFHGSPLFEYPKIRPLVGAMFQAVYSRSKTPEQAVEDFVKEANAALGW